MEDEPDYVEHLLQNWRRTVEKVACEILEKLMVRAPGVKSALTQLPEPWDRRLREATREERGLGVEFDSKGTIAGGNGELPWCCCRSRETPSRTDPINDARACA